MCMNMFFTPASIEKLSSIFEDSGQVVCAAVVIPAVLDRHDPSMLLLGIGISLFLWTMSIYLHHYSQEVA